MKVAVYYGPGRIEVEEWPVPRVGDHDILVKVRVTVVCGTDVKTFRRGHPLFRPPVVLGHEFAGEVVETGKEVREAKVGERVTIAPFISDDTCFYCRAGFKELCPSKRYLSNGTFGEYVKIDDDYAKTGLVRLAPDVSWEEGALTEPIACVVNAITDLVIRPGDTVAVVGAGPMGLLNALVARSRGAERVVVLEINERRRQVAAALGFATVDPHAEDGAAAVKALTEGRGADEVILAVGSSALIPGAMSLARPGGRVMLFGGFPQIEEAKIDPNLIHYQQITLLGSSGFTPDDFAEAGRLTNTRAFDLRSLVTHRYRIDEIREALAVAGSPDSLKVAIVFDD